MSHCTKFDFAYTDEQLIVRAFKKMNIPPTAGVVAEFGSDFGKALSNIGYMGKSQYRAICGHYGDFQIFVCKQSDEHFELFVEYHGEITPSVEKSMNQIESQFRKSYIRSALDNIIKRLELKSIPSKVSVKGDNITLKFGSQMQYSLAVRFVDGQITEEVKGVKGNFCTALTEDFENLISNADSELHTSWTQEYRESIQQQEIEVLRVTF